jgi:hypothetical protein
MDLSPQHIEMVSKASEIQRRWKPKDGDFYVDLRTETTGKDNPLVYTGAEAEEPENPEYGKYIDPEFCSWIPRFDQYQDLAYEILGLGWLLFFAACAETYNQICMAMGGKQREIYPETIALMLIMGRGFNLAWNSQEKTWIKPTPASQIIRV